ncbi:MAG: cadherin-like domain-containing protein, partial [Deltaproteobacteria bacterium]|nr:cadherin-like domain-containing protein [Deltaproteobacteria bacterium]
DSVDAQAFQTDLLQKAYAQVARLDVTTSRMAHIDVPLRPAPLSFAGDYMDVHHFGTRGHTKTMDQVIREMQRRHWGPSGKATAPAFVSQPKNLTVTQGASVTLTTEVSGFPYPSFQWIRDGVPIVAATASQYTFFAYRDSEKYTVRITNSLGHKDSQPATVTVTGASSNHPPVTVADSLVGKVDQPIVTPASVLLANDSDLDAKDKLHFAGLDSFSDKGGKLGLFGPSVVYTPPEGFSGEDHFAYLVSDNQGARRRGEVTVQVGDKERIEFVSPVPGELEQRSEVQIRWSTTLKAVRIEWSESGKDGPWKLVGNADSSQASWPGFTWTVPSKATETCYLRLSAAGSSPTAVGGPYVLVPSSNLDDAGMPTDTSRPEADAPGSPDNGCSCHTVGFPTPPLFSLLFLFLFFFYRRLLFYRRRAR